MNSESHCVPTHFIWQAIHQKRSVLFELKGITHIYIDSIYTIYDIYNQVRSLMMANQSINLILKLLTVCESDCAIYLIEKICVY